MNSSMSEDLTKPKLTPAGLMILKQPHDKERIAETASLGQNELWSSENLYRHLRLLKTTFQVNFQPSGSAHPWIEAVFLCVSAMLPHNQHMVFKMMRDDHSYGISILSRFVDYIAIAGDYDPRSPGNSTLT